MNFVNSKQRDEWKQKKQNKKRVNLDETAKKKNEETDCHIYNL